MNRQFRARRTFTDLGLVVVCSVLVSVSTGTSYAAWSSQDAPTASGEFQERLDAYLALRRMLLEQQPPLQPTTSAPDLATRRSRLATALRVARAMARPGDLVPADVAAVIQAAIADDYRQRTAAEERATFSEVPAAARPTINRPYPADAALPTVPPLLLMRLPPLPEQLQYRFYGRHLVLLDSDARIIVDYIVDVLPRR